MLTAPFQLEEEQIDAPLEVPVGDGRRIDIEVGLTVIEIKRDLRRASAKDEAVRQLAGYVATRTVDLGQRYSGLLTDGVDWSAFHLSEDGSLVEVSRFVLTASSNDMENFIVWLEGFLATAQTIQPTPREIERRLGASSSAHALDRATISDLYSRHKHIPTVALKRELWSKLLRTALGTQFPDTDALFVEHTLLVVSAEVIAHAVVGFDMRDVNPASLLKGALFTEAQIHGVVESDFFDWIVEVPNGDRFIRSLARRLSRFAWSNAEHDVMKTLYESIISAEQRKSLGEYYTPDWLANRVVAQTVTDPKNDRVLDPACGSGTFLFHAIRLHLSSLESAERSVADQLDSLTKHVFGIDIHPVAVTLARVTYLLAIGTGRLRHSERPPITVPVFLGDTIQWNLPEDMFSFEMLVVPTTDQRSLLPEELRFPDRLLDDTSRFDGLIAELSEKVHERKPRSAIPSLSAVFRRFAIREEDRATISETFALMCSLHDQGRDHIWGYYVRNVARPMWLSRMQNRVNVLVGNPPWLSFRFMPTEMQLAFKDMSQKRGLWHGAAVATNQDLSGLFVARTIQLYLCVNGRFGFVLPEAALSRRQYQGFRTGVYNSAREPVTVAFEQPWSLHGIKPAFFPVPACAIFGTRTEKLATPLVEPAELWQGRLPSVNASWVEAESTISRSTASLVDHDKAHSSPYHERFGQGATLVPRMLFVVERAQQGPLGTGAGRVSVRSERSNQEKKPWKYLPGLEGAVESQFLRPMVVGESIIPFSLRDTLLAVIPWDGRELLKGDSLDLYPGLARWWRSAERTWEANRKSATLSLAEQLNYRNKLTDQAITSSTRVVYSASGMYLSACRITDTRTIIDKNLYWASCSTEEEGWYLVAILNSPLVTERVRPLQARGEHNPRHFDKHIWKLPIPEYNSENDTHIRLAQAGAAAEQFVRTLPLPSGVRFESVRRLVREALVTSRLGSTIDALVNQIIPAT
ncbi:N-6 DNA methylase [Bradyrhizobium sp. NBAIM32]|uniref:N-6 DNA methylase n=1 Tax=Bradyrhizobium sp. NBAIM32 TaxID=2793809 RepID=UPI001CD36F09|nr:N-6 DNA methylase [Bradyrhizobium sp. NBAIM32]MCA1545022.1 N-6 DNA methylase [Bradyrhizobium sp. NBAIM32]